MNPRFYKILNKVLIAIVILNAAANLYYFLEKKYETDKKENNFAKTQSSQNQKITQEKKNSEFIKKEYLQMPDFFKYNIQEKVEQKQPEIVIPPKVIKEEPKQIILPFSMNGTLVTTEKSKVLINYNGKLVILKENETFENKYFVKKIMKNRVIFQVENQEIEIGVSK